MESEKENIFDDVFENTGAADSENVISPDAEAAEAPVISANAEATEVEGEYHFSKPERRLYEDASFVPQEETSDPRSYYVPEEKKPKEKKPTGGRRKKLWRMVALCLVCALLGGLAGGGLTMYMLDRYKAPADSGNSETPIVTDKNTSKTLTSANSVYEKGCQQVVGITTAVTYTNLFGQSSSTAVSGTGFVVTSDGYILTNYHVIEYAYKSVYPVNVLFKDGTSYEATIVGVEEENDLAVLKIDATNLTPATMGDSSTIRVGDTVYAIGNPLGELDFSMTTGSISALDRTIITESRSAGINMFQFDAAVNSGNSGGPVYNTRGEVIGIVTAKSGIEGTEGLGFAIPINDAVDIANDLITKGYVSGKAYLGVNIDTRYTSVYAEYYNMPEGAYVFNVESGSCAEKAGLAAGDIITSLGDNEIKNFNDLNSAIRQFKAGDTAQVIVYRNNDYVTLNITFDESKPDAGSNGVNESGLSSYPQGG